MRGRLLMNNPAGPFFPSGALVLLSLALVFSACSKGALKPTGGGIATREAVQLSLVVAQTRAQFSDISGSNIPFSQRSSDSVGEMESLKEPVLQGTGTSISPGVQEGKSRQIKFALYLNKPGYDSGFMTLATGKGKSEKWNIVAFDKHGSADDNFEFLYALTTPSGALRYLAIVGGSYQEEGFSFLGFEGTMVEPGDDFLIENWSRGYKIDFGYKFPLIPVYQQKVADAETLFRRLERHLTESDSLNARIEIGEKDLAGLISSQGRGADPGKSASNISGKKTQLEELQGRLKEELAQTENVILRYYKLREEVADGYALFVQTNPYRWPVTKIQKSYYEEWKPVELHHPLIDQLTVRLLSLLPDPAAVKAAQKSALSQVEKHDNWNKNPTLAKQQGK